MITRMFKADKLKNSSYNPRRADPDRLKLVELSLRKLGFLLPICVNTSGEILSGNQRYGVATDVMGAKELAVAVAPPMDDISEKSVNLLFNRATNDFNRMVGSKNVTEELGNLNLSEMAEKLPDIEVDTKEFYPCMSTQNVKTHALVKKNVKDFNAYSTNVTRTLSGFGIDMPVIITPDGHVVNGIGRVSLASERKNKTVPAVVISKEKYEFAKAMLNLLSMDFAMHDDYKDILRYCSYRRPATTRAGLGLGMFYDLFPNKTSKNFKYIDEATATKWKEHYGTSVIDFGAGKLSDTQILRNMNVNVTPFEPFLLGNSQVGKGDKEISRERSVNMTKEFLEQVKKGVHWDTIFISSVFNSVPFMEDRRKIVIICSALCDSDTTLQIFTMNTKTGTWQNQYRDPKNNTNQASGHFAFDYEPGTMLSNYDRKMKIQKFHSKAEMVDLVKDSFRKYDVKPASNYFLVKCQYPIINMDLLDEALQFEFDLLYPDGERMGLVDVAIDAFHTRLENRQQ